MAQGKNTASIIKTSMKLPTAGKRLLSKSPSPVRRASGMCPLPPSLLKLPTGAFSTSDVPSNPLLDDVINESTLDSWLIQLDKEAKTAEKQRITNDVNKSVSRVSFANNEITSSTSASSFFDQQPPKKKRRFARRNSFIVRDLSQLSRVAERLVNSSSDLRLHEWINQSPST